MTVRNAATSHPMQLEAARIDRHPSLSLNPSVCSHYSLIARIIKTVMVPKASQRANGQQLAIHLLNARDNERVEVAHIRGAIASDLPGAIEEWHAVSRATRCKKYLYSLSINPDPRQGALTRRQYKDYIARVEKKLGLAGQPRAIVFHIKEGREHCHVVWSRIIPGQLKAVQISNDRKSLQTITRRFAKDHGLTLPENMTEARKTEDGKPPARVTLHEKHQQERTGISKEQRAHEITQIWQQTDTGSAFVHGLEQAGYHLARGDSVPYAVIDRYGEIHSLPRQIEGVRTKDVRARLKDFPPESLPAAAAVKERIRNLLTREITPHFNESTESLRAQLKTSQDSRRAVFHRKLAAMKEKHRAERTAMALAQKENLQQVREARLRASAEGFMAILCAIPGIRTLIARRHRKHDLISLEGYRQERRALLAGQRHEFEDLKRHARAVARVEKREWRSLKTKILRDFFQTRITVKFQAAARLPSPAGHKIPTHSQAEKIEAFHTNARDLTRPVLPRRVKSTLPRHTKEPDPHALSAAFEQPAPVTTRPPAIRPAFSKAACPPQKPPTTRTPRPELDG